jgi:hypothetical protein
MKTLILAMMILSVMQALGPVPGQAADNPSSTSQSVKSDAKSDKKPTAKPPVEKPTATNPQQDRCQPKAPQDEKQSITVRVIAPVDVKKDGLDRAYIVLTGALVAVGMLTLLAIWKQAGYTRKAADAALFNAQAVINAERPWVIVTVKQEGVGGIASIFYSSVRGRTPAIILSNWADRIYVGDPQNLPVPPIYGDEGTVFAAQPLVTADDPPSVAYQFSIQLALTALTDDKRSKIAYMDEWLCVYGRVRYTDLLAKDAQGNPVVHETRWCYVYYPTEPAGTFVKDGPPAYNGYT